MYGKHLTFEPAHWTTNSMLTPADSDLTLPSIIASLAGKYAAQELVLTIIFHPDTSRIGHRAVLSQPNGWQLRGSSGVAVLPSVVPMGKARCPLEDPHISRSALQFSVQGKRLTISRFEASSRCRVGGRRVVRQCGTGVGAVARRRPTVAGPQHRAAAATGITALLLPPAGSGM